MKDARYAEIRALAAPHIHLSLDAFVSAMASHGVDEDELADYGREKEKRERDIRRAMRR